MDLSGFRAGYREWGPRESAQPVVLLHAVTSSSLSWRSVGPALGGRHRVLAVDLKGHGESGRAPGGYRISDQARR